MTTNANTHRPLLVEQWLPIRELGIESVRESAPIPGQFPKLKTLHVWWARRPLAAAQGVQLAAVLPPWSDDLLDRIDGMQEALDRVRDNRPDITSDRRASMTNEDWYHQWVLWLAGVWGDTISAQKQNAAARASGRRIPNPFTWSQAFKNRLSPTDLNVLHRILVAHWGEIPKVLDPTAGGGTIPYTAQRYGLPTYANDINPVAVSVLEAGLHATSTYGPALTQDLKHWGEILIQRLQQELAPYFPSGNDGKVATYLWVNTVVCPRTGGPVPLSPDWWLDKKGDVATRPVPVRKPDGTPSHLHWEVVEHASKSGFDPNEGTVSRGHAVSLWDGLTVEGDHIKAEAQAGRMWAELYAVACKKPKPKGRGNIRYFRRPTEEDLNAVRAVSDALNEREERWSQEDVLPTEPVPAGNDARPHHYGMSRWRDMFSERQLLVHGMFVEKWREVRQELLRTFPDGKGEAIAEMLALMQAKAITHGSKGSRWDPSRGKLCNIFERHDFAFRWTFGEFEGATELWPWTLSQLVDAYQGISEIMLPSVSDSLLSEEQVDNPVPASVVVSAGSATELAHVTERSIANVICDPPYYDNVMYAELSDFLYVWEKRTLGLIHPERFAKELTDKDNEAVANTARFDFVKGKQRQQLADADYQSKMRDIFLESRRVMHDDGAMVLWFTHKKAEAWDTLGAALMDAGFTVETSWPIHTESASSLNQANKNAAKSTIILVCRKRREREASQTVFFEDVVPELRAAARDAARRFESVVGHGGVDLMLSTYGPTLSVLSRQWPVHRSEADASGNLVPIRPEEALDIARGEVAKLRIARLVGHERRFDGPTDFAVLCWSLFADVGFAFDEARKLALGVGADVEALIADKVLSKKGANVTLVAPQERAARRIPTDGPFDTLYDALSVMLRLYSTDGAAAVNAWLNEHALANSVDFRELVVALANAIPREHDKDGKWTVPLAGLIDEVAQNVPVLGLRLAEPKRDDSTPEAEALTLQFDTV